MLGDNVTPLLLMGMLTGRTDAQSYGVSAPYIGKRLKACGEVIDVSHLFSSMSMSLALKNAEERGTAYLIFEQDHERLEVLHPGDTVCVTGRIKDVHRTEIRLVDCRLI